MKLYQVIDNLTAELERIRDLAQTKTVLNILRSEDAAKYIASTMIADQWKANRITDLERQLERCVNLLDTTCLMPDGSNADTLEAHILLNGFVGRKNEEEPAMGEGE